MTESPSFRPQETILGDSVVTNPVTMEESDGLGRRIRTAVLWRSGSQIAGQMIAWAATFLVIRILSPADYGLYAMTQVMLMLFTMLNGYGLASAVIQQRDVTSHQLRQTLGLLLLINGGLALLQIAAAPLAAAYYREPQVATLLRVQAIIYLTTPFTALAYARLGRALEFRRQAQVNILCSLIGAAVALGGALAGWGVWALVWAPIAMFTTRALGFTIVSRSWILPSFDFRGAGTIARYGGLVAIGQFFGFIQSQADILVAGRLFDAHLVGVYTTALFLTQIFNNKIIPPLNEVAFTAYSRLRDEAEGLARPFARAVRAIMAAAMPFFLGLAVVAEPLVLVLLGDHALLDAFHSAATCNRRDGPARDRAAQRRDRRAHHADRLPRRGTVGNRRDRRGMDRRLSCAVRLRRVAVAPGNRDARGRPARRHSAVDSRRDGDGGRRTRRRPPPRIGFDGAPTRPARGNRRADLCGRAYALRARDDWRLDRDGARQSRGLIRRRRVSAAASRRRVASHRHRRRR